MTSKTKLEQALNALHQAIEGNRVFFLTAKGDSSFQPIRAEVDGLLDELLQGAKAKAEQSMASAQLAVAEMKQWHSSHGGQRDYHQALVAMTNAEEAYETSSYSGYLDSGVHAAEAEERAREATEAQRSRMKRTIVSLQLRASQLWSDTRQTVGQGNPSMWPKAPETIRGDLRKWGVHLHDPQAVRAVLRHAEEGWLKAEVESYQTYWAAEVALRECLHVGVGALERVLKAEYGGRRSSIIYQFVMFVRGFCRGFRPQVGVVVNTCIEGVFPVIVFFLMLLVFGLMGGWGSVLKVLAGWFAVLIALSIPKGVKEGLRMRSEIEMDHLTLQGELRNKYYG